MITELPNSEDLTNTTESTSTPPEKRFLEGYYDKITQTVDYGMVVEDIKDAVTTDKEKVLEYLSTKLLSVPAGSVLSVPTIISYADTSDYNVELMQSKLELLGATDKTPLKPSFVVERSYTISTFRTLQVMNIILRKLCDGNSISDANLSVIIQDQVKRQTTSGEENHFREELRNSQDMLQYSFKDADVKKNKGYINPEGKVTEKEMGTKILPRVINALRNISKGIST